MLRSKGKAMPQPAGAIHAPAAPWEAYFTY